MITVINAWHKRGYSGNDHLLSDSELEPIIGKEFESVAEAKEEAEKISTGTCGHCDVPIAIEARIDGEVRTF